MLSGCPGMPLVFSHGDSLDSLAVNGKRGDMSCHFMVKFNRAGANVPIEQMQKFKFRKLAK